MSHSLTVFCLVVVYLFASCANLLSDTDTRSVVDDLTIRMERKGCYGRCPIYTLNIAPDGNVRFEGKGWTKTLGARESKISRDQMNDLASVIRGSDFFALRDSYETGADGCPTEVTDMPTVILYVRLNSAEKTVSHYHGCLEDSKPQPVEPGKIARAEILQAYPRKLTLFEDRIDEIIGTKAWVGDIE